jgi:hypothetical protein
MPLQKYCRIRSAVKAADRASCIQTGPIFSERGGTVSSPDLSAALCAGLSSQNVWAVQTDVLDGDAVVELPPEMLRRALEVLHLKLTAVVYPSHLAITVQIT